VLQAALERCGGAGLKILQGRPNPVAYLKEALKIEAGKKDDIICVSLDSPYPSEADLLVNNIVEAFVSSSPGGNRSTAREILKTLRSEKARQAEELTANFQAMEEFKRANGIISLADGKGSIMAQRLGELSAALTVAEVEAILAKAEYDAARAMMNDPGRMRYFAEQGSRSHLAQAGPDDAELAAAINQMQLQLVALKRQRTEGHPAVQALQAQLARARQRQAKADKKFAENHLALCAQRLSAAQQKQGEIRAALVDQQKQAEQMDARLARCALLEAAFKRSLRMNELLDSRISEVALASDVGPMFIRVLEEASSGDEPTRPNRPHAAAMALGLGLILGVMLALLAARLDHRIHSAADVPAVLGLPLLGAVPTIRRRRSLQSGAQTVLMDPASPAAEAYRDIRTAVCFGVREGQVKTLLVTSAQAGDGKTTLVSNLGIAMAQAAQRTLILDADLRNPMQHEVFDVACEPGLTGLLAGTAGLQDAIRFSGVERLDVLPCGAAPDRPAEMLHSPAFRQMLAELSGRYDRIVIDSPPVVSVTDSRILGAICEVTVLVLRAEKSTHPVAQQAIEDLLDVGARLLGAVINAVPRGNRRYGRYSQYGYRRSHRRKASAPSE
ncbi:MAG: hypothetical protein AMJ81_14720, partial [Phycisphaerae bacterium SM23_33]